MDWKAVEQETLNHLQKLVRFDTTNPPGNETPAAQYLADVLRAEGIEAQVLESAPGRGSLVARLKGTGEKRPLLLLSHLDVVPAVRERWEHDPFAAEVIEGYLWGRGTVDTKQLTAMELMTVLLLKRQGLTLKRDVILAATADEEMGGKMGVGWLMENHPQLLDAEYAINEGGGFALEVNGQRIYLCHTAEKGVFWIKLRTRGRPGHASTPKGDNAVVHLAEVLARLGKARLPMHRTNTVETFIKGLARTQKFPKSFILPLVLNPLFESFVLSRLPEEGLLKPALRAMLHNTATPTVLRAGEKTNVIPSVAEAQVDCRMLPGQTPESVLAELKPYLGEGVEVETIMTSTPYETDYRSELYETIREVVIEHDPGSEVLPFLLTASSDSRYLAQRGIKVYGFAPMKYEPGLSPLELAHGDNERISLESLAFGTRVFYEVVRRFVT